ncbi:hypothetical protein ACSBR2_021486 [Camellia fascicularis]
MDNITIFGHIDGDLRRTVQFLQERNANIIIRDERDLNVIHVREAKEKEIAKALLKKNEKTTVSDQGNGKCMFNSMALQHFHFKFFF